MDGRRNRGATGEAVAAESSSDQRLLEILLARLHDDDGLDASRLDVKVSGGSVTLAGEVADRWMKQRAEDIVDALDGAIALQNHIRVNPPERPSNDSGRFHSSAHGDETDSGAVRRAAHAQCAPVRKNH